MGVDNAETEMLYAPGNGNLLTGNFIEQMVDFKIESAGQDLIFSRTYNSELNKESTILGNGWISNLDTRIKSFDENFGRVIADLLNVREDAGIENKIVSRITYNTKFEYLVDSEGKRIEKDIAGIKWNKIKIINTGVEGFVASSYIRKVQVLQ